MRRDHRPAEPLGVQLLPCQLERFALRSLAGELAEIPRVVALEPPRVGVPKRMREFFAVRQAMRVRLPGELRLLVLYEPDQYPLARGLLSRYPQAEMWYLRRPSSPEPAEHQSDGSETSIYDALARERAAHVLVVSPDGNPRVETDLLRRRLLELEVISARPFLPPGARVVA